jgi:uncharacterized protein (DUF362 family)/NAD-dependent dihydropyrimidine dehydrogenase PreA subunit
MSRVAIVRCADYSDRNVQEAVEKTLDLLGGIRRFVKPGMTVALKPNLLMKKSPGDAITTHPSLIKALCRLVKEAGGRAVIADSPGGPYTESMLKDVFDGCGMEKAAAETGARLNFDLSEAKIDNPLGKYLKKTTVIRVLADADIIINVPKLKTHGMMTYTGAVKNMFGAVPGMLKAEYHMRIARQEEFASSLIDIFLSVKPTLNIMDAVIGMEGEGPSSGDPKHVGLVAGSEDAFSLDKAMLKVIGAEPGEIPVIRQAIERGLCREGMEDVEIAGEDIRSVLVKDFRMPVREGPGSVEFFKRGFMKWLVGKMRPKPVFIHDLCIGCGKCAENCPVKVISMTDGKPSADLRGCIRCFCCQELCPARAVVIKRPFMARLVLDILGPFLAEVFLKLRGRKK